ncbi:MAG TPA: LLM class flavin-dependent oxidoreductase [Caulobacteraceae bacterium]
MSWSVLDLSPVSAGNTPAQAIGESIELARAAERLGYNRYWLAEHHSMTALAGTAPEVLIAAISQVTQRIRLGSGGVMLPNYSPLKVAEVFMGLEALAPGRIDLGVGRALGADMRTGAALRAAGPEAFPQYFALLSAWLLDAAGVEPFPDEHPAKGIRAQPQGPSHPDLFLLVSSVESARFAGQAGVGMVFSEFIARADAGPAVAAYREAFEPSPFRAEPFAGVGLIALAADTAQEAERLDAVRKAAMLSFLQGREGPAPTVEEAVARLEREKDNPTTLALISQCITGDGATVRGALERKLGETGADELFVMASGPTLESRVRSLELIAD